MISINIKPFLSTDLTYRSAKDTGAISDVKRLAPSNGMPLRFSKVIRGSYARLITYENTFLQEVHNNLPNARVVRRISDTDLSAANGELAREIVTKDAGVDISKWYALPVSVDVNGTRHSYPSAFCHPVMLLYVTLHILKVFKNIHEAGIVHCDIKEDQICIPAKVVQTEDSYDITPDFENITLIDFGNALWDRVSIYKEYNPLPFNTDKALPYQSKKLIKASQHQQDYFKKHGEYSFTQALNDVDYSVDLYSLGYMLKQMLECQIKPNLSLSDPLTSVWSKFITEYETWINELLQYDKRVIKNYSTTYLPYEDYIKNVNRWLSLITIPTDITFNTSASISLVNPTVDQTPVVPTPLLGTDEPSVKIPDNFTNKPKAKKSNKVWFAVIVTIALGLLLATTLSEEQNYEDTSYNDILDAEEELREAVNEAENTSLNEELVVAEDKVSRKFSNAELSSLPTILTQKDKENYLLIDQTINHALDTFLPDEQFSYNADESNHIQELLSANKVKFRLDTITGNWKCRKSFLNFGYPFFNCKIYKREDRYLISKIDGSQTFDGYIEEVNSFEKIVYGQHSTEFTNTDRNLYNPVAYDNNLVGRLEMIDSNTLILVSADPDYELEIIELRR